MGRDGAQGSPAAGDVHSGAAMTDPGQSDLQSEADRRATAKVYGERGRDGLPWVIVCSRQDSLPRVVGTFVDEWTAAQHLRQPPRADAALRAHDHAASRRAGQRADAVANTGLAEGGYAMTQPGENVTLPEGVSLLTEPWVSLDACAECGCETGDGYNAMVPLAGWEAEIEGWGWLVVDGRLLCFDCIPPGEPDDA